MRHHSGTASVTQLLLFTTAIGLLFVAGCGGPPSTTTPSDAPPSAEDGERALDVLRSMVAAYRETQSYADDAQVVMSYVEARSPQEERVEQSLKFVRPDRISFVVEQEAFRAHIASDGDRFVARITDESTDDMAGQVIVRPAPEVLQLSDLTFDEILYNYINGALIFPTQLELLLSSDALSVALGKDTQRKLLDDAVIDGHECYRVRVEAAPGNAEMGSFVFSIDKHDFVLRRLDYPSEMLRSNFPPQFHNLALRVDYRGAKFNVDVPQRAFQIDVPENALQVTRFVATPPLAPLPVDLYGKRPDAFIFIAADGKPVSQEGLLGRTAVLLWFVEDEQALQSLAQVAQLSKTHDDAQFAFLGVLPMLDANVAANADKLMANLSGEIPVVKDNGQFARDVFDLRGYPTLIVLDKEGKVQYAELGPNPELARVLPEVLLRIAKGEDVAASEAARLKANEAAYQQQLAAAMETGPTLVHELPDVKLLAPTDPQYLKLEKLWSTSEIPQPGNLLAVGAGDAHRVLVVSGRRAVAELDAAGQLLAQHDLQLPERGVISYLRGSTNGKGELAYAASARMGAQVFLFDSKWRMTASYPPAEEGEQGLRDVQLADLGDNGKLQAFVGFWGRAGVHAIDRTGKTDWRNRTFPTALTLAVSPPNDVGWRKLLVTGEVGEILELNQYGHHTPAFRIEETPIYYLYSAAYAKAKTPYCGITVDASGQPSAVGLAEDEITQLARAWSHRLPKGIIPNQLEAVTSGVLVPGTTGQWLLAGPDGSLHVIGDDGAFSDTWNTGERLTGMAIAELDGAPALILATEKDVTAWKVTVKKGVVELQP